MAVADRLESELEETRNSIRSNGGAAISLLTEVGNEHAVGEMTKTIVREWGAIDILVNNASIFPERVPFEKVEFRKWREVIDINLFGTFYCCQAVARLMIREKTQGRMINISSLNGSRYRRGTFGQTQYNVSKAALDNLTKGLAMELAPHGIVANGIALGFVRTQMAAADPLDEEDFVKEYLGSGRIPLGRYGTPEDCANLALFLASEECTWMTGETIHLDGGMHFTF